jgi:hypothetical protein
VIEAQMIGPAATTDPQAQTEGYLFLVGAGPRARPEEGQPQGRDPKRDKIAFGNPVALTGFAPGATLVAWLALPGAPRSGVIVPRDAVLRHEGETFVYLQKDDVFQRQAVALERPVADGWFVGVGTNDHSPARANNHPPLQPQEKVVVVGAQQLLSEELKGQGGEE